MVEYKCNKCNKIFGRKSHYDYHINRKTPCKKSKEERNQNILNYTESCQKIPEYTDPYQKEVKLGKNQCQYCKKNFTQSSSLNRHIKDRCKIKKQQDNDKENLLEKLVQEMKKQNENMERQTKQMAEMKEEIIKLKSENKKYVQKISSQNNNICTNIEKQQNNILMNNNIKLLAFGKEDVSHLADEVCRKILNKGFKSVPTLVEHVHFNKNKPENHNVYISNIQTNYALVYDGIDWKLKERDNVLQQLVDDKTAILSDKFDELLVKLDDATVRKFQRFLDQKDDDTVISGIKNDLKLLLYNNKKIPERTRELLTSVSENSKMIEPDN